MAWRPGRTQATQGSFAAVCFDFGGIDVSLGLLDPGKDLLEERLVR